MFFHIVLKCNGVINIIHIIHHMIHIMHRGHPQSKARFHDNASYDVYKTPQQIAERIRGDLAEAQRLQLGQPQHKREPPKREPPKSDLILTLQLLLTDKGLCEVEGRNMAGDLKSKRNVLPGMMVKELRRRIQRDADPNNVHNVILCLQNGQLLTEEHDDSVLEQWSDRSGQPDLPDRNKKGEQTGSGSARCGCSIS